MTPFPLAKWSNEQLGLLAVILDALDSCMSERGEGIQAWHDAAELAAEVAAELASRGIRRVEAR